MRFSVYNFCLSVLTLTNLKLYKTSAEKNAFIHKKLKTWLTFNLGLALIGFRTTGPRKTGWHKNEPGRLYIISIYILRLLVNQNVQLPSMRAIQKLRQKELCNLMFHRQSYTKLRHAKTINNKTLPCTWNVENVTQRYRLRVESTPRVFNHLIVQSIY